MWNKIFYVVGIIMVLIFENWTWICLEDPLSLMHRFKVTNGKVTYQSKYLQSGMWMWFLTFIWPWEHRPTSNDLQVTSDRNLVRSHWYRLSLSHWGYSKQKSLKLLQTDLLNQNFFNIAEISVLFQWPARNEFKICFILCGFRSYLILALEVLEALEDRQANQVARSQFDW